MKANRSKDASPEMRLRRAIHARGVRFRLHAKELPGKSDLVLPSRRSIVFVHGCYWHQHQGCKLASVPTQRKEYWGPKLSRNLQRDAQHRTSLEAVGWHVVTVWECETRQPDQLARAAAAIKALPIQKRQR